LNQQTGARIEYFEIIYYTDDQQLLKTTYFIGTNSTYLENPRDFIMFSREGWFDDALRLSAGGIYWDDAHSCSSDITQHIGSTFMGINDDNPLDEKYSAILVALENKQTIYVDVIRVGYTTFDGSDIVINFSSNQIIIQRLELTKNGNAFTFGNAEDIENVICRTEQQKDRFNANADRVEKDNIPLGVRAGNSYSNSLIPK
jgi:hypothetical protein